MTWVITKPCECNVFARCIEHCPEKCIATAPGETQYYVDPSKCTNCGGCDLACPVAAIFPEEAVPEQWRDYIEKNRAFFEHQAKLKG